MQPTARCGSSSKLPCSVSSVAVWLPLVKLVGRMVPGARTPCRLRKFLKLLAFNYLKTYVK